MLPSSSASSPVVFLWMMSGGYLQHMMAIAYICMLFPFMLLCIGACAMAFVNLLEKIPV